MPEIKPDLLPVSRRITDIYIYVMLSLFPLFTGIEGYANVTISKYVFFVSVTCIWLLVLLVLKIAALRKKVSTELTLVELFVLLYLVFCIVSSAFSPYGDSVLVGEGRFDGLVTIVLCVCIFFGVSLYARPKKTYIYAAAAAVTINCIVAVLQLLGYNPLWLFPGDFDYYDAGVKFTSTFLGTIGNADLFSAYICLVLPLVCIHYITDKKRPMFLLPTILLTAFSLFVCGVSGGMLALAITALIAAPIIIRSGERLRRALEIVVVISVAVFLEVSLKFADTASGVTVDFVFSRYSKVLAALLFVFTILWLFFQKREFTEKPLKVFFSAFSVVTVVIGLITVYFWKGTEGTVYELSQVLHGNIRDSFGSSRILIWRKTLELVPKRLLLGGGSGTLALRLDVNFSRFVEETGKTLTSNVDNAHNDYLGILVNTGLLSLLTYVSAQVLSFVKAVRSAKPELLCLAFALLCYWVQAFFGLGLFLVSPLMWLLWGLLVSVLKGYKTNIGCRS